MRSNVPSEPVGPPGVVSKVRPHGTDWSSLTVFLPETPCVVGRTKEEYDVEGGSGDVEGCSETNRFQRVSCPVGECRPR